jgi:hypothetical protein
MVIKTEYFEFFALVCREIDRADAKHGNWRGASLEQMYCNIQNEVTEVGRAAKYDDVTGPHGMLAELPQVACTAFKFWREVRRAEAERAGADAIAGGCVLPVPGAVQAAAVE